MSSIREDMRNVSVVPAQIARVLISNGAFLTVTFIQIIDRTKEGKRRNRLTLINGWTVTLKTLILSTVVSYLIRHPLRGGVGIIIVILVAASFMSKEMLQLAMAVAFVIGCAVAFVYAEHKE